MSIENKIIDYVWGSIWDSVEVSVERSVRDSTWDSVRTFINDCEYER